MSATTDVPAEDDIQKTPYIITSCVKDQLHIVTRIQAVYQANWDTHRAEPSLRSPDAVCLVIRRQFARYLRCSLKSKGGHLSNT